MIKSPSEASAVDYVVCAHKAIDQEKVAVQLQPVVDQNRTTIVIIQNGVGNEEAFREQFPGSSILTCVVSSLKAIDRLCTETDDDRPGWERHKPVPV